MSNLKHKPQKIKYLTNFNTLDELHKEQEAVFNSEKQLIPQLKENIKILKEELQNIDREKNFTHDVIRRKAEIKGEINSLNDQIYETENGFDELEYYTKTSDILCEYYKNNNLEENKQDEFSQDYREDTEENMETVISISSELVEINLQSRQKRKVKKETKKRISGTTKKRSKDILSFFGTNNVAENADGKNVESLQVTEKIVSNKATLLNDYKMIIDKSYVCTKIKSNPIKICRNCKTEKILVCSEGLYVCKDCGESENVIIDSEIPNHKESATEKPRYPYKRLNHFVEWLNQFQAKESTPIDDKIYINTFNEIKKNRLENKIKKMPYIRVRNIIKCILKTLRYSDYYEHIPTIISKITNKPPPVVSREIEDKLKIMFKQTQEPFNKHRPRGRINYLNYSYVLNKFFKILGMENEAKCFPLLKSRDKLKLQDSIWKKMCIDLNWPFHSSI